MCFGSKPKPAPTPAAAPAPPLPAPDLPEVGSSRKAENEENFGGRTADYRVKRDEGSAKITPGGRIKM